MTEEPHSPGCSATDRTATPTLENASTEPSLRSGRPAAPPTFLNARMDPSVQLLGVNAERIQTDAWVAAKVAENTVTMEIVEPAQ